MKTAVCQLLNRKCFNMFSVTNFWLQTETCLKNTKHTPQYVVVCENENIFDTFKIGRWQFHCRTHLPQFKVSFPVTQLELQLRTCTCMYIPNYEYCLNLSS